MRIIIKGGSWKNTEDEVLKVAVSKYGKNQWARISSLLVRKTPKQCKARWYEWLDPSIKKTEWNKAEDEKLLHMAKLMPTQWRTIAPVVGRTATQCLERYQMLLDEAEHRDNVELGLTGPGEEAAHPSDARKLKAGEIDTAPESRAARPDPMDMDEDEKEMLSEARARLANTQGKKAKRKARERQLEEARRLAVLQKRRELKAAGIFTRARPKNKGGMDYNADIPFEKQPAPGFYDVSEENAKTYAAPVGQTLRRLDQKRKTNDSDLAPNKKKKNNAESSSADSKFDAAREAKILKLKEAEQIQNRQRLSLPAPQVGEAELDNIVKIGQSGDLARRLVHDENDGSATGGLISEYDQLASTKNIRTPRLAPEFDNVMAEARNLRNMTNAQTPLLGEENVVLHESTSGYTSATPRHTTAFTPNPLATPRDASGMSSALSIAGTPRTSMQMSVAGTPRSEAGSMTASEASATPRARRDELSINRDDDESSFGGFSSVGGETPGQMRRAQKLAAQRLQLEFDSMDETKYAYTPELEDLEDQEDEDDGRPMTEEDAAERDRKQMARLEEEKRLEMERRSKVIKLNLPRPPSINYNDLMKKLDINSDQSELTKRMTVEMLDLVRHDSIAHPISGSSLKGSQASRYKIPSDQYLDEARRLMHSDLAAELEIPGASEIVVHSYLISQLDDTAGSDNEKFDLEYSTSRGCYVPASQLSVSDYQALLTQTQTMATDAGTSNTKLGKKLEKILGGYQKRSSTLHDRFTSTLDRLESERAELASFSLLSQSEEGSIPLRTSRLTEEVRQLQDRERELQGRFGAADAQLRLRAARVRALEDEVAMRRAEVA